jgi:hypothetical protein
MQSDEAKKFSGTAGYTIRFGKPAAEASAWELDLGRVCSSATGVAERRKVGYAGGANLEADYRVRSIKRHECAGGAGNQSDGQPDH